MRRLTKVFGSVATQPPKQTSYSQSAIDQITQEFINFDSAKDIIDYRDVLSTCATLELNHLIRILDVLKRHLVAPSNGLSKITKKPYFPERTESIELNLVPIWIPSKLYLADFIGPAVDNSLRKSSRRRLRPKNQRNLIAKEIMARGFEVPEDFEVYGNQIVSFQNLFEPIPALSPYYDAGTVTDLQPKDFYAIDQNYLNVFKSLLRRCLQRQLRRERVLWQDEFHLFFFGNLQNENERKITWKGERTAERTVYKRTMKTKKADEILSCKHLAFQVAFHLIEKNWYLSITPTWFFSQDGYRKDKFGADHISWIKRQENDQQVHTHFRFILNRFHDLQENSLFEPKQIAQIQVGDPVTFNNHPFLPDQIWNPSPVKKNIDTDSVNQYEMPL